MSTKNNTKRTKEQLIEELTRLRKRITESEKLTTEQKMIEEKLKASEVRYRSHIEVTGQLGWVTNAQGKVEEDIASWRVYTGQSYEEIKGDGWAKALHPDDVENTTQIWQEAIKTKSPYEVEYRVRRKDGEYRWFFTKGVPVFKEDGTILEWIGTCIDITEHRKIEKSLMDAKEKWHSLVKNAPSIIMIVNLDGVIQFINHTVPGLTVEDVIGKTVYDYIPKIHHNIVKESLQEVARTGKNSSYELEGIGPHGTKAWYSTKVGPIKDQGRIVALMQITSDITERREAEKKIKVALGEKEMLLKEIHHRIKNNLQVITSLLNLQSRYIKNKEDKDMFKHAQNRIKTMALVHEKLYGSQDFMYIDFKEYIHSLSNHLFSSYVSSSKIDLRITVENVLLDIDTAIPCSLIINELVTNSIKYAFPNSKKGRISIALNMRKKEYVLIVADNGKGLPENFDYRKTESLGLQLVCALTEQLHGKITLGKNKGTEFTITFRKK